MQKLLFREERCTAVLTFDDLSAFGAIRAIEEKGLSVPEDISVVGFDDIPAAAYYNPPLTTVRQPTREMGIKATTLLLKLISGEDKNNYPNPLILQPELILRNSCQTMV
jgi:DNA-binding LacI/PurR family transcriptional regulator